MVDKFSNPVTLEYIIWTLISLVYINYTRMEISLLKTPMDMYEIVFNQNMMNNL